jgi:hypothetical protein
MALTTLPCATALACDGVGSHEFFQAALHIYHCFTFVSVVLVCSRFVLTRIHTVRSTGDVSPTFV